MEQHVGRLAHLLNLMEVPSDDPRSRTEFIQAQTHTEAERDALAVVQQGRLVWNSTGSRFQVYNGSWLDVYITGDSVPGGDITGQIDGDLLYNRVDGALLWGTVDGTL